MNQVQQLLLAERGFEARHSVGIPADELGVGIENRFAEIGFIGDDRSSNAMFVDDLHRSAVQTRERRAVLAVAGVAAIKR